MPPATSPRPLALDTLAHTGLDPADPKTAAHGPTGASQPPELGQSSRPVFEKASDALVCLDDSGTILRWNDGAEQSFGWRSSDVVGKKLYEVVIPTPCRSVHGGRCEANMSRTVAQTVYRYTPEPAIGRSASMLVPAARRDEVDAASSAVLNGERVVHDETSPRKDGSRVDVPVAVSSSHDPSGAVVGGSMALLDVTEQRRVLLVLQSADHAREAALEAVVASEARSRRFLADVAHQLRTPIAGIQACAEGLLRAATPDERDRLLAYTVRETSRAARLMTSLLQMARLEQAGTQNLVPCNLMALCRDEAASAAVLSPTLEIRVSADIAVDVVPMLDGDAVRELVANLLDNGRRHAVERIDVVVHLDEEWAEVRVLDDGPGVAPENAERIFERFVSLDGRGGSGLGLAIASDIARAHGGNLDYRHAGFCLRLPVTAPGAHDGAPYDDPGHLASGGHGCR